MKWYWSDAINRTVLKAEAPHTCRKWDSIQVWATKRVHVLTQEEKELEKNRPRPARGIWTP